MSTELRRAQLFEGSDCNCCEPKFDMATKTIAPVDELSILAFGRNGNDQRVRLCPSCLARLREEIDAYLCHECRCMPHVGWPGANGGELCQACWEDQCEGAFYAAV